MKVPSVVAGLCASVMALALAVPASASEAVTYQLDAAHTGATTDDALDPPFVRRWAVDLGQPTSYPLIAGGRVFVVVRNASDYGTRLVALDATNGQGLWGRSFGGTYYWSGIAYAEGVVYAVNGDGLLVALDAGSGATRWSRQLPGQYSFSSEPTVAQGRVYVGGAGSGGTLYAVDASTGDLLWTQPVCCGDHSSPAVGDGRVHVGYVCDVYGFDAATGARLWHHNDGCSGGGGRTTVLHDGRLYTRDGSAGVVHDAATGAILDTYASSTAPAFAGGTGFLVSDGRLEAVGATSLTTRWTFSDGGVSIAPIVVNEHVIVGSATGHVYALDRTTGAERWRDKIGRAVLPPDEHNVSVPVTGLGAGQGLLVVPADGLLVAYGSGTAATAPSPLPAPPSRPDSAQPPPAAEPLPPAGSGARTALTVSLRAVPGDLLLGEKARLRGRVVGTSRPARRLVALEVDEWPFGRFRTVVHTRTDRAGRFRFVGAPRSNIRLRVRLVGRQAVVSRVVTVYVDFAARIKRIDAGGRRPRVRLTIYALPGAPVRRGPVYAYLAPSDSEPYRLVSRRRWQRRSRRHVSVTMPFPPRALKRSVEWVVCAREPHPDRFGRPSEIDRRCGQREIDRGVRWR